MQNCCGFLQGWILALSSYSVLPGFIFKTMTATDNKEEHLLVQSNTECLTSLQGRYFQACSIQNQRQAIVKGMGTGL